LRDKGRASGRIRIVAQDSARNRFTVEVLHDDRRLVGSDDFGHRHSGACSSAQQICLSVHRTRARCTIRIAPQHKCATVERKRPCLARRATEHAGQVADLTPEPRREICF
jgi:hypothetical protein